jgi:flagellar biosynthesis/type III secretory pathway protein FliH
MPHILEVNEQVRPEALQALLDREIGPETKDTIVTAGQQLIKQGLEQGLEQGLKQGLEQGIVRSLVDVYEARFGAMSEAIRAVIEATHDEPTLRVWLKLAGTRGADEIAAAVHAVRAS